MGVYSKRDRAQPESGNDDVEDREERKPRLREAAASKASYD